MRRCLTLSLCGFMVATAWAAQRDGISTPVGQVPQKSARLAMTGDEELAPPMDAQPMPGNPARIGDMVAVGTTTYEYQANGSLSKMVAISADGVAHGVFMYSGQNSGWSDRKVKAWCVNPDLSVVDALDVYNVRSGYGTAAVTGENPANGLAPNSTMVSFHTGSPQDSWFGADFGGCTHAFNLLQTGTGMMWPHVAVDGQDHTHVVNYDSASSDIWYQASSDGISWDAPAVLLTSDSRALGSICVGSKTSPAAAVLFHQRTSAQDIPYDMGEGFIGIQVHHDLMAYRADDGDIYGQYNSGNLLNITNYGPESTVPFGDYGSRLYCDLEGIFDRAEDPALHVGFTGGPQWTDTLHVIWDEAAEDSLMEVYMNYNLGRGQIWHHNVDSGSWSHIWGSNGVMDESEASWVDAGAWRQRNDHPSFAIDPETGYLYCAWNQFSADDMGPVDAAGSSYPNGEIFVSCSADNGETWGQPVNVTDTFSDGCASGTCQSESWHSLAEVANGYLHLSYVLDTCPGGFVQEECFSTTNNFYYHRIPVGAVPPHAGTPWNAGGRVSLAQTQRWFGWYYDAWCDSTGAGGAVLDSVKWIDPVHLLNESPYAVQLDHVSWHHNMLDQIGTPEQLGITEVGITVKTPDGYVPLDAWNGTLPQWKSTKFNVHFAYSGLTNSDVLIGFHFSDDRPSLYYRLEMVNALQDGELETCTGVNPIPVEDIAQYEETVLHSFTSVTPPTQPVAFALAQNVPNPFNPSTSMRYSLDKGAAVTFKVFNLAGQLVQERSLGFQGSGWHQLNFDGSQLASGVYVYTIQAGAQSMSQKMILTK